MAGGFVPVGNDLYSFDGLVEDPAGSGLYAFNEYVPPSTGDNPHAHLVYEAADLLAGTETITVRRSYDGLTSTVREAENKFAAGGTTVDDWEIPTGVDVAYSAQMFDSAGASLGFTSSTSVRWEDGPNVAWISDPLDGTSAISISMAKSAGQSPTRPTPGAVYQVGLRIVALVGQQPLLRDLNMDFYTRTTQQREQVAKLVRDTGGLVLIRTPPPMMVPRLLYCWAAAPAPMEYNLPGGVEKVRWSNTVQEISPIEGNLVVSAVSWQTYMDAFPTWADFNAAYSTWFDAMKNPPGGN